MEQTTYLKLCDGDLKSPGCSNIMSGSLTYDDPAIAEGIDFEVDCAADTVRRLRNLGEEYDRRLVGFTVQYEEWTVTPGPTIEERLAALEPVERERILGVA